MDVDESINNDESQQRNVYGPFIDPEPAYLYHYFLHKTKINLIHEIHDWCLICQGKVENQLRMQTGETYRQHSKIILRDKQNKWCSCEAANLTFDNVAGILRTHCLCVLKIPELLFYPSRD